MTNVDLVVQKDVSKRKNLKKFRSVDLRSSFLDTSWSTKGLSSGALGYSRKKKKLKYLSIVDELGGQYEEGFDDVKNVRKNFINFHFTLWVFVFLTFRS